MDKAKLRANMIKLMLGCLVLAAAVAIVTILIGKFSDTTGRALGTVFVALLHIGIVFGLVSVTSSKAEVAPKAGEFVINSTILIAVLSFLTSVFALWGALSGDIVGKLYVTYIVALFVLFHGKSLFDMHVVYPKVRPYVYANFVFIAVVAAMLLGLVYAPSGTHLAEGFYGRLLAASAIVDVTLSVIVAVMHRLYLQQHPELLLKEPAQAHRGIRPLLIVLLFVFVAIPLLQMVLGVIFFALNK
jgi:uncharacterized membrane protein